MARSTVMPSRTLRNRKVYNVVGLVGHWPCKQTPAGEGTEVRGMRFLKRIEVDAYRTQGRHCTRSASHSSPQDDEWHVDQFVLTSFQPFQNPSS